MKAQHLLKGHDPNASAGIFHWCIIDPESSGGGCFLGSVLHGSARTTSRIRAEFQASQESSRTLAARYRLHPKTVRKWRKTTTQADQPVGPEEPQSTVATQGAAARGVAFQIGGWT